MSWYMLEALNTETRGDIRYRTYTRSEKQAKSFREIPRINFTDSGHGIIFISTQVSKRGHDDHTGNGSVRDHVEKHWRRSR